MPKMGHLSALLTVCQVKLRAAALRDRPASPTALEHAIQISQRHPKTCWNHVDHLCEFWPTIAHMMGSLANTRMSTLMPP